MFTYVKKKIGKREMLRYQLNILALPRLIVIDLRTYVFTCLKKMKEKNTHIYCVCPTYLEVSAYFVRGQTLQDTCKIGEQSLRPVPRLHWPGKVNLGRNDLWLFLSEFYSLHFQFSFDY